MRIILRKEWGARHDNGAGPAPLPAREVWAHHTVSGSAGRDATFDQDAAKIRDVEAIGESRFGTGISYTWLITESGRVFEGHSANRLGTHTANRNGIARAISFVGNYDNLVPSEMQLKAAAWLLQEAKRNGWITAARLNGGHRDLKATACPGNHVYANIAHINNLAAGPPITEEADMPLTQADAQLVADTLLATSIKRSNDPGEPTMSGEFQLRWLFAATDGHTAALKAQNDAQLAAINALSGLVASKGGLTVEDVEAAVRRAMADVVTVDVRVTAPSSTT